MARPYLGGTTAGVVDVTADKTLVKADSGKIMSLNSSSAITVTLPTDANVHTGFTVKFIVQTANNNAYTIITGDVADSGGDDFVGGVILASTTAGYAHAVLPAANDCNIILDTGQPTLTNVKRILATCNGRLHWINGLYTMKIDDVYTGSGEFNFLEKHIIGGISIIGD